MLQTRLSLQEPFPCVQTRAAAEGAFEVRKGMRRGVVELQRMQALLRFARQDGVHQLWSH